MQSLNFDFFSAEGPELADFGGLTELSAHADPDSAAVKLRLFGEVMVGSVYHHLRLHRPPRSRFIDLLKNPSFKAAVPSIFHNKSHSLQVLGLAWRLLVGGLRETEAIPGGRS